jgi:hypothetical protein
MADRTELLLDDPVNIKLSIIVFNSGIGSTCVKLAEGESVKEEKRGGGGRGRTFR